MEFALVLPVLILLLGGIIDFGFVFAQQIQFNTAARDAARSGVVKGVTTPALTCSQVATRARDGSATIGASPGDVRVVVTGAGGSCTLAPGSASASGQGASKPCTGSAPAATTSLTVTLTYASTPPFPVPFLSTVTLTSRGDFQCEYT